MKFFSKATQVTGDNPQSGAMMPIAVLSLMLMAGSSMSISAKIDEEAVLVGKVLNRQTRALLENELHISAKSLYAIQESAKSDEGLKDCLANSGKCNAVVDKEFTLKNAFGDPVAGTKANPVLYTRYGARCQGNCKAAFQVTSTYTTSCAKGAATCNSANSVSVKFDVVQYASRVAGQDDGNGDGPKNLKFSGQENVSIFSCPEVNGKQQVLTGYSGVGAPKCSDPPSGQSDAPGMPGPRGDDGPAGDVGEKGAKGPPGFTIVVYK